MHGRSQKVVLNGKESETGEVNSGVVQGSTLGPTLFLIFINDIKSAVNVSESPLELATSILSMFADDTKWGRCVNKDEDRKKMQQDIDNLSEWSQKWQLHFNTDKCKIMQLGNNNNRETYQMNGCILEHTVSEKDIGVYVQDNLKPSLHCTKIAAKANAMLGQLSRAVLYRDRQTFIRLYIIYIRPILEYCIQAVGPYAIADKLCLRKSR